MADVAQVLFDEEAIHRRVEEMAVEIRADYLPTWQADPAWSLMVITVLRGGVYFLADLTRALRLPLHVDFVAVTQYQGRSTTGSVRIVKDLEDDIEGRDVLVVEDIIDTGLTLRYLLGVLASRRPRSLRVATLLDRPDLRLVGDLPVAYTGFRLGDVFVVGYGLDYRERYRDLPFIGVPKDHVFSEH